jgi:hypothetical protein
VVAAGERAGRDGGSATVFVMVIALPSGRLVALNGVSPRA